MKSGLFYKEEGDRLEEVSVWICDKIETLWGDKKGKGAHCCMSHVINNGNNPHKITLLPFPTVFNLFFLPSIRFSLLCSLFSTSENEADGSLCRQERFEFKNKFFFWTKSLGSSFLCVPRLEVISSCFDMWKSRSIWYSKIEFPSDSFILVPCLERTGFMTAEQFLYE